MAEFQTDFIISWDFREKDMPAVLIARLSAEEKATHLIFDALETFYTECGVASVRQVLEEYEARQRCAEVMRKKSEEKDR